MKNANRPDITGTHQTQAKINKRKILASQSICAICGKPVDPTLHFPDPWCATVDHIIPIAKGGHPSALDNMQLAHFVCNRQKSDKLFYKTKSKNEIKDIGTGVLPQSADWATY